MSRHLVVESVGPAVSLQDGGRSGGLGVGLSRGGAADRTAWLAAHALLGLESGAAAIEMAGYGGGFRFEAVTRFALSGAVMRATLDGAALEWQASHLAAAGSVLEIGAAERGVYGYLLPAAGIATKPELGGRGFHRSAGLGRALEAGDRLPLGEDANPEAAPMRLRPEPASGEPIRVMPGPQTDQFTEKTREIFEATRFRRSPKANRQGVRLDHQGSPFSTGAQLHHVSDFICEGDIQMTGDGTPYVLLAECQTMGGYPRIGTVLPADLPRIAQAGAGEEVRFRLVTVKEAERLWRSEDAVLADLRNRLEPRVRDPREMADLLRYELIGKPLDDG